MRRAALLVIVVFTLAACGGSSGDDPGASSTTGAGDDSAAPLAANDDSAPVGTNDSSGDIDCAALGAARAVISTETQSLAQVSAPNWVAQLSDFGLDIDAYLRAVDTLRPLEGVGSPLGSPKETLDLYQSAGEAMKAMMEADAVTQADVDAYNEIVGTVGDFIGSQIAINGALGEAGC